MNPQATKIVRIFLLLSFLSNFAASLVRGIDTLFLIDAGLTLEQVFIVYAFMTIGTVLFEIPTGAIADIRGRRRSYLIGTVVLGLSTLAYWFMWQSGADFIWFAITTFGFGIGYTFFSGATEAWLVDALKSTGYEGDLEQVFSKSQAIFGISMLTGTLLGGVIAEASNLGIPYLLRFVLFGLTFVVAFLWMRDLGFSPKKSTNLYSSIKETTIDSIQYGYKHKSVRWMILSGVFMFSVMGYVFYALQPYLLELYGDDTAYATAALAATVVAGAQVIGALGGAALRRFFKRRSTMISLALIFSALVLIVLSMNQSFYLALGLLVIWSMALAVVMPIRQSFLNTSITESDKRATVLSVDSLVGSSGGVVAQPALARVASLEGLGVSFLVAGIVQLAALPFLWLVRKEGGVGDLISNGKKKEEAS